MAVLVCLATPVACLIGAGIACMLPSTMESLNNAGAHGFSEVLYAYSSGAGNNGSAFEASMPIRRSSTSPSVW